MIRNTRAHAPDSFTRHKSGHGLISLAELDTESLARLITRSGELYNDPGNHASPLAGQVVGMLFTKTSTRTRTAFTVGAVRLGGTPIAYGPNDLQTNTGESLEDTGRMFAAMLDLLVARTSGPTADLRLLSGGGVLPVINAMTTEEHPTQGICDLATMQLHFGTLEGLNVLYVGEGNNTATALARGLTRFSQCNITLLTPLGYGIPDDVLEECTRNAEQAHGSIVQTSSFQDIPTDVDVVYTTRWQTTGTSKSDPKWREVFRPYHVDEEFMRKWPGAIFMHDLPAHRGEEVASAVLEGATSIAWLQASMKLFSAMAILEYAAG